MKELSFDSLVDGVEYLAMMQDVLTALGRGDWFIGSLLQWF